ncbi:hypothetical protein BJV78DRAFT_1246195 [Lactifluus subvellereus]|nr:hypothetical protein BJV78DRAFT_1246195 [Lactifluus subvellereus]
MTGILQHPNTIHLLPNCDQQPVYAYIGLAKSLIRSIGEIHHRWLSTINARPTNDKLTATKIKRDKRTIQKAKDTWEHVLTNQMDLPDDWITSREVLVGKGTRLALMDT